MIYKTILKDLPTDTMAIVLEPRKHLDSAIVDYDKQNDLLVYDYDLLIDAYMRMSDNDYHTIAEHISYNIEGTIMPHWPTIRDSHTDDTGCVSED